MYKNAIEMASIEASSLSIINNGSICWSVDHELAGPSRDHPCSMQTSNITLNYLQHWLSTSMDTCTQ